MSEKYALIAAEKADPTSPYPVIKMCVWLEVSTSGFYDHGNALPSTRALAADLGVTRRVVVEAYDQLAAEGYVSAGGARGPW